MVNILGEHQSDVIRAIPGLKDWKIHLYGKDEPKHKRKMGHATILRPTAAESLAEIDRSGIWSKAKEGMEVLR
ncbi:phosphoribosylaminoimidazole carboxylase ATPase subunit [Mycobacteroides abscessus subsp. abscessus]|nr:phosphoribosylaminoimidazole carboxylase ATPase subunit [Mycobacteroides abscessus subsp. abscessus]